MTKPPKPQTDHMSAVSEAFNSFHISAVVYVFYITYISYSVPMHGSQLPEYSLKALICLKYYSLFVDKAVLSVFVYDSSVAHGKNNI